MTQHSRIFYIYGSIFSHKSLYAEEMLYNWRQHYIFYCVTKRRDEFVKKFLDIPSELPQIYVVQNGREEYVGGYEDLKKFLTSRVR